MNNQNLFSVGEVCKELKISRNTAYRLLKDGELDGFRVGRMWRIPEVSIRQKIKVKENERNENES